MLRWGTRTSRLYHEYVEREAVRPKLELTCNKRIDELLTDPVKVVAGSGDSQHLMTRYAHSG